MLKILLAPLAIAVLACGPGTPSSARPVVPPELRDQPGGFVPIEVVMRDGRRPPQPGSCRSCPSGECDIRFTRWCNPDPAADQRDWWVCAPRRDEQRSDGCPARSPLPESACTEGQRCTYPRCPGADITFDDIATCSGGAWDIISEG
jgi:hypothetical protein